MPPTDVQPIHAEIVEEHDKYTKARLVLFGEPVTMTFSNGDHYEAAAQWVVKWNDHLGTEWNRVREAAANMMEKYQHALEARGVATSTLDNALQDVQANVQG